jgi:hypothetical protein
MEFKTPGPFSAKSLRDLSREVLCSQFTWQEELEQSLLNSNFPQKYIDVLLTGEIEENYIYRLFKKVINSLCPPEENPSPFCRVLRRFVHYSLLYYFFDDCEEDENYCYITACKISNAEDGTLEDDCLYALTDDADALCNFLLKDLEEVLKHCQCERPIGLPQAMISDIHCDCIAFHVGQSRGIYRREGASWIWLFPDLREYPT